MALRPCLDCHVLVARPRCRTCQRAYDNATGRNHYGVSSSARGYGADHQAERARWAPVVAEGTVSCARCDETIKASDRWDLGHTEDRSGWTGPEHARCNRAAGLRKGRTRAAA